MDGSVWVTTHGLSSGQVMVFVWLVTFLVFCLGFAFGRIGRK